MNAQELIKLKQYCSSLTEYKRFETREVSIGDLKLGGNNPIRIQSMTTTDTMDTMGTVEQSIRMIEAGCELVRITAPSKSEAENLLNIKNELRARGYNTPLVADIHFTPNAAEIAARIVEKVRVNPGNYADKKKFENIEYTDVTYLSELERIRERFTPLVKICKEYGTAMRIGTNHGSLSDRILSRYGDTPLGMVESAMEFLRICRDWDYHNIVLSMKASNTRVMVQAYRLLVNHMMAEGMNYPLHLGVTEAGEGEDGRIKSAVGIGALLEDGIGDTIRVSLTEDPEFEAPVAIALADRYKNRTADSGIESVVSLPEHFDPFNYAKRNSHEVENIGGTNVPRNISDFSDRKEITAASLFGIGLNYSVPMDKWSLTDQASDYVFVGDNTVDFQIPGTFGIIYNHSTWLKHQTQARVYPLVQASQLPTVQLHSKLNFVIGQYSDFTSEVLTVLKSNQSCAIVIDTVIECGMAEQRRFMFKLDELGITAPVILRRSYANLAESDFQLHSATDFGGLLIDGFGDGIWINAKQCGSTQLINQTAFGILQAARVRISKTEYISCPSCGRTLFDLQETTAKIRKRTDHLKGIKIGIMGCIVNGPGEMADADYGYVGVGVGKISLYKGQEVVKRGIPAADAVDLLIDLIKTHGDWIEPQLN